MVAATHNSGNRCGHNKHKLEIFRENRNQFLNTAQKTIREWAKNPSHFLASSRKERLSKRKRQLRSERREAVASVLSYMMCYSNLATMRLGVVDESSGKFIRFGCQHIADKTGLSLSRIWQALSDLNQWGYIQTVRKSEFDAKGDLVHLVAVRRLHSKLFEELGLLKKFNDFQEKARKKLKKKLNRIQERLSQFTLASYMRDIAKAERLETPNDHRNFIRGLVDDMKPDRAHA